MSTEENKNKSKYGKYGFYREREEDPQRLEPYSLLPVIAIGLILIIVAYFVDFILSLLVFILLFFVVIWMIDENMKGLYILIKENKKRLHRLEGK